MMTDNARLVSVIIPVYNYERYLAAAIESALAQSHRPIHVIVINDGSTDGSEDVAKGFGSEIEYSYQPNGGIAAARNRGVDMARGDFLAFLDSDDLWVENKLEIQLAAFDADPELDAVFGHMKQFFSPEVDESFKKKIRCPEEPMAGRSPAAMMIKRESLFRTGLFDTKFQEGEWASWYTRAIETGLRMLVLPDLVAYRRLHENNTGVKNLGNLSERMRVLKASLDRRRAAAQKPDNE